MTVLTLDASETLRIRAATSLRRLVGENRGITREMLAADAQVEARTLRAHITGETVPTLLTCLRYAEILGPDYASPIVALAGLRGLCPISAEATKPSEALRSLAEGNFVLARALEDGVIDHQEAAELVPALRDTINRLTMFVAMLERRVQS